MVPDLSDHDAEYSTRGLFDGTSSSGTVYRPSAISYCHTSVSRKHTYSQEIGSYMMPENGYGPLRP